MFPLAFCICVNSMIKFDIRIAFFCLVNPYDLKGFMFWPFMFHFLL